MNDSINLDTMTADSTAALRKLAKDLKDLRKLIEMRALKENIRQISINPEDLQDLDETVWSR